MSQGDSRRAASFLVRLWVENREADEDGAAKGGGEPIVRGFVRNLQTGQERYVSGHERLARDLFYSLEPADEDSMDDLDAGVVNR